MSTPLRAKYAQLLAVFRNALDAIISIDEDGTVLTFNPAAEALFQYNASEVVKYGLELLMPASERDHHSQYILNYLRTGNRRMIGRDREVICERRDGSQFCASLSVSESVVDQRRIFTAFIRDLSDSKALRARVDSLRDILEHSLNALYVFNARDGKLLYANATALAASKWSAEEVEGRCLNDVFSPAFVPVVMNAVKEMAVAEARTLDLGADCQCKDGGIYPATVHLSRATFDNMPAFVASIIDISSQKQAEFALKESRREHETILRYAPIGIVAMDERGCVTAVNHAVLEISGYEEHVLVGKRAIRFMHTDEHTKLYQAFRVLLDTETSYSSSVHQLRHADGHSVPVRTFNAIIDPIDGGRPILISMLEDLSEEHARDEELKTQRERLSHVAQLTQMGEMAAGLAHELNQPLSAISSYASAGKRLLDGGDMVPAKDLRELCARIDKQSMRAGKVIQRIRALTRRHETSKAVCSVNGVVNELLPLIEIDLKHTSISLSVSLDDDAEILADAVQIEQVLLNFIRNAVDSLRDMALADKRIVVTSAVDDGEVRVTVTDNGPGIEPSRAGKIFEPFVTSKSHGMGMGLSISKTIIEAHDGKIGFDTPQDGGAAFWFTLPRIEKEAMNEVYNEQ